jgi:hypothetical protein
MVDNSYTKRPSKTKREYYRKRKKQCRRARQPIC